MVNINLIKNVNDERDIAYLLKMMLNTLANPPWLDKTANQQRAQVTGTLTTVTTVTTVTTLANFGTQGADVTFRNQNNMTWGSVVRSRIT